MRRTLRERIHNPRGRECGCPPTCVCQRTLLGRMFRWYMPRGWHEPFSREEKRRRGLHRA